jgi:hypothetical protein
MLKKRNIVQYSYRLYSPSQNFVLWKKKILNISTFLQNNLIIVEAAKVLWYPDM